MEIMPLYFVSQVLAFIAIILAMLAYQKKRKAQILGFTIISDILFGVHYLLLNAWSGVVTKIIAITRDSYVRHKGKQTKEIWPLILFICVYVIMAIVTFQSLLSFLPLIAALIYTIGIYNGDEQRIRIVTIISCLLWLIYNFSVHSYVGMASDLILITSSSTAYYRFKKKNREQVLKK